MIEDRQSSIIRPRAVPPMFTPVASTTSQPTNSMISNPTAQNRTASANSALIEIISTLRRLDPEATNLHDCLSQVKLFAYNSIEFRWENTANIEGNLCAYEKKHLINNILHTSFAFMIIQGDQNFVQPISIDMAHHGDNLRLFYEVTRNNRREVFCIHFSSEDQCSRLKAFITNATQALKKMSESMRTQATESVIPTAQIRTQAPVQPSTLSATIAPPAPVPLSTPAIQTQNLNADAHSWMAGHINGHNTVTAAVAVQQTTPNNSQRQQTATPYRNQTISSNPSATIQLGSNRMTMNPTPTRIAGPVLFSNQTPISSYQIQTSADLNNVNMSHIQYPGPVETVKPVVEAPIFPNTPLSLNNGNAEDPTSSLKRLLNIRSQTGLENLSLEDNTSMINSSPQTGNIDLMPPSAFEPINATPPSPLVAIGSERVKHRTPNVISREHFRNVILHLIQNDDRFLDIIYQACLNYPNPTQ